MRRERLGGLLWAGALLLAGHAHAHDSWLVPAAGPPQPGRTVLALTTGNRYPVAEFNPGMASLVQAACAGGAGRPRPLARRADAPRWLELALAHRAGAAPAACWVELKAFELELTDALVQVYFAEARPQQAIRQAWDALREQGKPWRESYRKYARIELEPPGLAPQARARQRAPVGLALELVALGQAPVASGQSTEFQLLRDGQPLADFPLELVSERSPLGVWRNTDAQGRLTHLIPFKGRWLLRGIDIRRSDTQPDAFDSRFVTLSFEAR